MKKILHLSITLMCFILIQDLSQAQSRTQQTCPTSFSKTNESTVFEKLRQRLLSLSVRKLVRSSGSQESNNTSQALSSPHDDFIFEDHAPAAHVLADNERAQKEARLQIKLSEHPLSILNNPAIKSKLSAEISRYSLRSQNIGLLAHLPFEIYRHEDQALTYPSLVGRPRILSQVYTLDFGFHHITVVVPSQHLTSFEPLTLFAALLQLPKRRIFGFKIIRINPGSSHLDDYFKSAYQSQNHVSAMLAHDDIIDVFPTAPITARNARTIISFLRHEYGHLLAYSLYKDFIPPQYDGHIDDQNSVSKYGNTNLAEDFAEAMMVYLNEDGDFNSKGSRRKFPNRFRIIDGIMGVNSQRQ